MTCGFEQIDQRKEAVEYDGGKRAGVCRTAVLLEDYRSLGNAVRDK